MAGRAASEVAEPRNADHARRRTTREDRTPASAATGGFTLGGRATARAVRPLAELAGIEGGGYGDRWRQIEEVGSESGVEPRVLKAGVREAGVKPARPGRHPMLSDRDVHKVMEESRGRGLRGEKTLTPHQRADRRATERQHKQTQRRLIKERLDRVAAGLKPTPSKPASKRKADPS